MKTVEQLKAYQQWRRGEDERTMDEAGLTPASIGEALDSAIKELGHAEKMRAALMEIEWMTDAKEMAKAAADALSQG